MELEHRLQRASKQQLVLLVQELVQHHPVLHTEIVAHLDKVLNTIEVEMADLLDEGVSDEWNFNGDEVTNIHSIPQTVLLPLDYEGHRQRIQGYLQRLMQGESSSVLFEDVNELLEEAEQRAELHDYHGAMDLYALIVDERLKQPNPSLIAIFDKAVDDMMPVLETLLSEASSNILFENTSLSPLLTPAMRQAWLERLFALWLRRMDVQHLEEVVPEMILNVAWSEDIALLRRLVQEELQRQPASETSNIVDFKQQYRTRTLEKFLKELPRI